MALNYRKLLEKTNFDLSELFWKLTHIAVPTGPKMPPPHVGDLSVPFVSIDGARSVVMRVEHTRSPINAAQGTITIHYQKLERQ